MGDFEILYNYFAIMVLGIIVYNIINIISFRDLLKRFGFLKNARRDFYECGFRPQTQRPIQMPIQFALICSFFLLYDIELVFTLPYVSGFFIADIRDLLLILFFFFIFLISLIIDYSKHALDWQYN